MKEKFEYNGFKYSVDYGTTIYDINIEHNQKEPEYIFKFYALNSFSIDAIINSYFYASHPFELNDILDSSQFLLYTSKPLSLDFYQNQFNGIYSNDAIEELWRIDSNDDNKCKEYFLHTYSMAFNLIGIISTTAKENNILMWPHYTQEKGFQIKFKSSKLLKSITDKIESSNGEFLGFNPINYCEMLHPIDISPYKSLSVPISYAANVKSDKWAYEDEWRILVSKANMGVPYSKAGLNLGPDHLGDINSRKASYSLDDIEEICLGLNFITTRIFKIEKINKMLFKIELLHGSDYENVRDFLNFISEKLTEKVYYSGVKYELDMNQKLYLIRTKEKINIDKIADGTYLITRTDEVIRLPN